LVKKKALELPESVRWNMIDDAEDTVSICSQCALLNLSRSTYYYKPVEESSLNLELMRLIDEKYTKHPHFGSRSMLSWLSMDLGYNINRKRVIRLMKTMGLEAIYPKPNLSKPQAEHTKMPYLLRGLKIDHPNQVWSSDITYIRMRSGFLYLTVIMDWYSRYVISWRLSNTMEAGFCVEALKEALKIGIPEISNTDQGPQYTSDDYINCLKFHGIKISMDGRGRALDNIFTERLWKSVKYEEVYLKDYETGKEAHHGIEKYFIFYNQERRHQSLENHRPVEIYYATRRLQGLFIEVK
jgi:putative transposase